MPPATEAVTAPHFWCPITTSTGACRCPAAYSMLATSLSLRRYPRDPHVEQIAESLVEDDFRRDARAI